MNVKQILAASAALTLVSGAAYAGHHEKKDTMVDAENMASADIVDTAIAAGSFKTLVAAVQAAGLEDTLRSDGPFTVFAPTDKAFAALPDGTVETLLRPENKDQLVAILTYHVAAGATKAAGLAGKTLEVETANGASLPVDGTDGVKVGGAKVIKVDIETSNGVIHVIDKVLLPPKE